MRFMAGLLIFLFSGFAQAQEAITVCNPASTLPYVGKVVLEALANVYSKNGLVFDAYSLDIVPNADVRGPSYPTGFEGFTIQFKSSKSEPMSLRSWDEVELYNGVAFSFVTKSYRDLEGHIIKACLVEPTTKFGSPHVFIVNDRLNERVDLSNDFRKYTLRLSIPMANE